MTDRLHWLTAVSLGIYRHTARLLPSTQRGYADDMTAALHDACRRADAVSGGRAVARALLAAFTDLGASIGREWLDVARHAARARRSSPTSPRLEERSMLDTLIPDIRHAVRALRRTPMFTGVVVGTLALGIGANITVFSLVHAVLVAPLPFPDSGRVVTLGEVAPELDIAPRFVSIPNYLDWSLRQEVFSEMALFRGRSLSIRAGGRPRYVYGTFITDRFFAAFGISPILGRAPTADEIGPGAPPVAVLSHRTWVRDFDADSNAVGQTVTVDGVSRTVIGIMPARFAEPGPWIAPGLVVDVWIPFAIDFGGAARVNRSFNAVGRLRPGTTLTRARADLGQIQRALQQEYPGSNERWELRVHTWRELMAGNTRQALLLVWAASGLLLLIACGNVANLTLNRIVTRRAELAVRAALGASRTRIGQYVFTESLMLAAGGGAIGLALAFWATRLVVTLDPGTLPMADRIGINPVVVTGTLLATALTVSVFGLLPAITASRLDLAGVIRTGGTRAVSRHRRHMREYLTIGQITLAFSVLVGAGLVTRSFARLIDVEPGVNPSGIMTATVALSWSRVETLDERVEFVRRTLDELRTIPGAEAVAMINSLPFSGSNSYAPVRIAGRPEPRSPLEETVFAIRGVSPGYFDTMQIPVRRGRTFERMDVEANNAAVINQRAARVYWPDEDPIGGVVTVNGVDATIVGIVDNVRHWGLETENRPELYLTYRQDFLTSKTFVVRTAGPPHDLVPQIERAILRVDPDQPVRDITSMEDLIAGSVAQAKFNAAMLGVASLVSIVLASTGLFAVMSYGVAERRREIGVRMALGEAGGSVLRNVVVRSLILVAAGIGAGAVASLLAGRAVRGLLFDITPHDPLTYLVAAGGFIMLAVLASAAPALRASRVDPAAVLRE